MEVPDLTCRPCGLHGSAKCPLGHFKCMKNLYPEIILKEIKNIISNQKIQNGQKDLERLKIKNTQNLTAPKMLDVRLTLEVHFFIYHHTIYSVGKR